MVILFLLLYQFVHPLFGQDYQVADINCKFPDGVLNPSGISGGEFSAKLRKPPGFMGTPLFADDRYVNPEIDPICQIRKNPNDRHGLVYSLLVRDLNRCGVTQKDGYVNIRIWFPQLDGVVLAKDQEVIIMCKPASPTIVENRAAGFAGALPSVGRVTGVVEESPGRLEYEVVLLKESHGRSHSESHLVDQAVPIGSRLQLRAKIDTDIGAWKFAKLIGVTVSTDPQDPIAVGHVVLVENGCRRPEFRSIVPRQPRRSRDDPGELILEFQAFMLDSRMEGASQLWIHATIKACVLEQDCRPETCLDLDEPKGFGRRRRGTTRRHKGIGLEVHPGKLNSSWIISSTEYLDSKGIEESYDNLVNDSAKMNESLPHGISTQVGDNVGLEVIFPKKFFTHTEMLQNSCNAYMVLSTCLGVGLLIAIGFLCFLTARVHKSIESARSRNLDTIINHHNNKYGAGDSLNQNLK
ncbi:UNVERIFIED_CONTAM: hypothetical protein RMT77_003241 [Armadillidium vulgare]